MLRTGCFPRFLPHLWPLPSNYFLSPRNVSLSAEEGGGKTMCGQKPPCCIKKRKMTGLRQTTAVWWTAKSSGSEVRKVKSRQESINSTCGAAPVLVLQSVNASWESNERHGKEAAAAAENPFSSLTIGVLYAESAARARHKCGGKLWVSVTDDRCG